jgi:hypothetical protein
MLSRGGWIRSLSECHGTGKDIVSWSIEAENSCAFGVLWDDGHTVPHPSIRRALEMTMQAVLDAGHKSK